MMLRPTQTITAAAAVAALTLTAACSTDADGQEGPATATTSPSTDTSTEPAVSTPSPSATRAATPRQEAIAAARQQVPLYFAAQDELLRNPSSTTPSDMKKVAISSELTELRNLLTAAKTQKIHSIGSTAVESITHPRVRLKNKPKASPPDVPTVQFDVCYDVSKVNLVDQDGKSVVPANRPPRGVMVVAVSNYSYPAKNQWRVSYTIIKKGKKC